jgi:erythronate-4-phosphate dehydrogenase
VLARGGPLDVVLDVWEGEPAINQAVLDRVNLGTPHIAGYSLDGKLLATQMLCAAMARHYGLVLASARGTREAPPLALEASREGADLLRFLLASRYDITRDDRALRAATGDRGAAAAAAFDDLRRHYPERRELAGSRVRAQGISAAAVDLIHGLGCSVVALEDE